MKLWRRWGWVRRGLFLTSLAALVYFGVLVGLAFLQADFDAHTFTAGVEEDLQLAAGETRSVYLTPEESHPLNFDFYPSDLSCEMTSRDGAKIEGELLRDERRRIDGWRMHWGVESFTATEAGEYELTCRDMSNRSYPLVLAKPGRSSGPSTAPGFGLVLFAVSLVVLGLSLLVGRTRDRRMSRSTSSTSSD